MLASPLAGLLGCSFVACTPANPPPVCYVSAPWHYELLCPNSVDGNEILHVHVTDWPDDEIRLVAKDVEGASQQYLIVEIERPRLYVEGFNYVSGVATESAEARDVWWPLVVAPDVVIYPPDSASDLANTDGCDEVHTVKLAASGMRRLAVRGDEPIPCGLHIWGYEGDGWSWMDLDLEIEESVRPFGLVRIENPMSATLSQLQQVGVRATTIRLIQIGDEIYAEYSSWLSSAGFTGRLERCPSTSSPMEDCVVVDYSTDGGSE